VYLTLHAMSNRGTFSAILNLRCPQCHEGKVFSSSNAYKLKVFADMPEFCPACNLDFKPEAGFYWGALYVSYGLSVLLSLLLFAAMYLCWGWLVWQFLVTDTLMLIFLAPVLLRYSRVFWMHICYHFFPGRWKN
jgi:uncharacterized protein (DUF983 family)